MEHLQHLLQTSKAYLEFLKKYRRFFLPGAGGVLFLLGSISLIYGTLVIPNLTPKVSAATKEFSENLQKITTDPAKEERSDIIVDVAGAVEKPGIYTLQKGDRLSLLIDKSGGFQKKANKTFIARHVNLSQKLVDEQKLYIPFQGEEFAITEARGQVSSGSGSGSGFGPTNINSASQSDLEQLTGIGAVKAQQIIAGRPYSSLEELVEKKILSQKLFTQLQDQLKL